ncbi:helix-turn-helix domain-containing protein [Mucilaginibacter sp. CAU 1740]|uniref:helix-turn-helix domain-containing protein n=1 Tax=Mucilaginibacter sp. CAU 1740 TaxID=3140365 RepID=UPI00325B661F
MTRGELEFRNNWNEFQKGRKWVYASVAIIEDLELSANAKILFMVINSYCTKYGIFHATNDTLSKKVGLKKTMLKTYLKELKTCGLITIKLRPAYKWPRQISINFNGLTQRYPLVLTQNVDISTYPKAFLSLFPLEKHPEYEILKEIYQCRSAGGKYLYYRPESKNKLHQTL